MLSLTRVRESFWFLPAVFGLVAVVLAEVLVTVDRSLPTTVTEGLPFPKANPYFLVDGDLWDDADWLAGLVRVTAAELPVPKPKKPKAKS